MQWSKTRPTTPGYYWARERFGAQWGPAEPCLVGTGSYLVFLGDERDDHPIEYDEKYERHEWGDCIEEPK